MYVLNLFQGMQDFVIVVRRNPWENTLVLLAAMFMNFEHILRWGARHKN